MKFHENAENALKLREWRTPDPYHGVWVRVRAPSTPPHETGPFGPSVRSSGWVQWSVQWWPSGWPSGRSSGGVGLARTHTTVHHHGPHHYPVPHTTGYPTTLYTAEESWPSWPQRCHCGHDGFTRLLSDTKAGPNYQNGQNGQNGQN